MTHGRLPYEPASYTQLSEIGQKMNFTMPSDRYIGSLLMTLVASKSKSRVLELGTGIGLASSWIIDGLDEQSTLITLDNDPALVAVAKKYLADDPRVEILCTDGTLWLTSYQGDKFELIFADTWPGKYSELEDALNLVSIGGFYVIDDMMPQDNWPSGHDLIATELRESLETREDFHTTFLEWSTGVVIATKIR